MVRVIKWPPQPEAISLYSYKRSLLLIAATVLVAASYVRAQAPAAAWWTHVVWLSDDALKGRAAGSEGHRTAAEYVAEQFEKAGLAPGVGDSYLQPVQLRAVTIDRATSSIAVLGGAREAMLDLSKDVAVNGRGMCGAIEAPLVFVGYGLHVPEVGFDDLAGQDLRGKVVVFIAGAPSKPASAVVAHRQAAGERWRVMQERGAIGQLAIYNPSQPGADWSRTITAAQQPTYALADAEEFAERRLAATVSDQAAGPIFEGSGHNLANLLVTAKAGKALPRFALKTRVKAHLGCSAETATSENVVAVLEGSDARLKNEYVVLTAHLDHIGEFGTGADTIYNGAMDNASGVASLIDLAARLRAAGFAPRRSLAFVAVTAEERNLLGSYYFVRRPPFPSGARMVANINLDMFLPIIPMTSLIAFGMEESSLQRDVQAAATSVGIVAERDPIPGQNVFIRSDQYNFVRAGVPAVMLLTGANGNKEIWKTWEHWMETRYHQAGDDAQQPVNFESAETFQRALSTLVRRVADAEEAPRWNERSVFKQ
jgi:Zn-dependent M28 family amino/carboxypeptidase